MNQRVSEMQGKMPFDAIVATSFENVSYLSGARIDTQKLIPKRLALVLWPASGNAVFIVCSIEQEQAKRESAIEDIRSYEEFVESPIRVLGEAVRERGLDGLRLGIEYSHLTAEFYEQLRREVGKARLESCDGFLDRVRMVKSAEEIAKLHSAAQTTDRAIWNAFAGAEPGKRDLDVTAAMQAGLLREGATVSFCVFTSEATVEAHPSPNGRLLDSGDLLRTDFGGNFAGYYSDLARTAVVREATERQRDVYNRLWAAHNETIDNIRAGISAAEVYAFSKKAFARNGLAFAFSHVGHSLGIGLHEYPILAPHVDQVLEAGMVLAFESLHDERGEARYHVEDLVEVTGGSPRILSRSGTWEGLVEAGLDQ